ncbi:MAG: WD40/YVTN/BNR-like repeat-containing protein [Marmoricola sp.]
MDTVLLVGTRKGLWIGRSDERRTDWSWTGPHFNMTDVYSVMIDKRGGSPRLLAAPSSPWTGAQLNVSDDLGGSWTETKGVHFPDDVDASVERVWQLVPGVGPDTLYAGTEPGAIFRSEDGGQSFELVRGLWDHPHRSQWGAGFGGQAFHTILPHPTDPQKVTAALSAGGCYQTTDGGGSWQPRNVGIRAEFLPEGEQYPEFGQCVHKIARNPEAPERLFLQNHGGVYRSDDEGATWQTIHDGLPVNFGFPVVVHPHRTDTAYVFPLQGSGGRFPADARAMVWGTSDAGKSWTGFGDGLPEDFYVGVMRDAMVADDHDVPGLYVGARNGTVWVSPSTGEGWVQAAANLPDVMVVRAASI